VRDEFSLSHRVETKVGAARAAYLWACELDVLVRKPGNVSVESPGHGMRAEQFIRSAHASADALFASGVKVGSRIERAIERTWATVHCNTNLGIVLLCAPMAAALDALDGAFTIERWQSALDEVLADLDLADAGAAYRAIALAQPGGLGHVSAQDASKRPTVNLREAMHLAADRDLIARQYTNGFSDLFDFGVPVFAESSAQPRRAMLRTYLAFLSHAPDSHIVRKMGPDVAQTVTRRAVPWYAACCARAGSVQDATLDEWDEELKSEGINPGTSADLAVAAAFVAATLDPTLRSRDLSRLA